jgi:hypothetical protein
MSERDKVEVKVDRTLRALTDVQKRLRKVTTEIGYIDPNFKETENDSLASQLAESAVNIVAINSALRGAISSVATDVAATRGMSESNAGLIKSAENARKVMSDSISQLEKSLREIATELKSTNETIHQSLDLPTHIEVDPASFKVVRSYITRDRKWKSRLDGDAEYGSVEHTDKSVVTVEDVLPHTADLLFTCVADEVKSGTLSAYVATNPGDKVVKVALVPCSVEFKMTEAELKDLDTVTFDVPYPWTTDGSQFARWVTRLSDGLATAIHLAEAVGWELDPEFSLILSSLETIATTAAGAIETIESIVRNKPSDTLERIVNLESLAISTAQIQPVKLRNHSHNVQSDNTVLVTNIRIQGDGQVGNVFANSSSLAAEKARITDGKEVSFWGAVSGERWNSRGLGRSDEARIELDWITVKTGMIPLTGSTLATLHGGVAKVVLLPDLRSITFPTTTKTVFCQGSIYAHRTTSTGSWTYPAPPGGFSMLRTAYGNSGFSPAVVADHYANL